jgi:hypothetical protein
VEQVAACRQEHPGRYVAARDHGHPAYPVEETPEHERSRQVADRETRDVIPDVLPGNAVVGTQDKAVVKRTALYRNAWVPMSTSPRTVRFGYNRNMARRMGVKPMLLRCSMVRSRS